jgi:hypothetical protein
MGWENTIGRSGVIVSKTSTPSRRMKKRGERTLPPSHLLRVSIATAAAMLDVHYETLRDVVSRGVFSIIAPKGRGLGKRIYLYPDEVAAYVGVDELAVRSVRQRMGRILSTRKGK